MVFFPHILRVEPTGFVDGLDVGFVGRVGREFKDDSTVINWELLF